MIRVNLLPQKRRKAGGGGRGELWLVACLLSAALEVVGCLVLYGQKKDELTQQLDKNKALEAQIKQIKDVSKNHDEIKTKLAALRDREEAIAKLQSARSGPTAMLLEVARLMTPGRGPSVDPNELSKVRRENPTQDYNGNWDPRRLWLTKFVEQDRTVRLEGIARDGEDVSELARRMNLSTYFDDVQLLPAKRETEKESGLPMVAFKLEAKVRY
jgi:type IV pilus assembly protein PilN